MHTFDEYKLALDGAGPKLKEMILDHAAHNREISFPEVLKLQKLAYPDPA